MLIEIVRQSLYTRDIQPTSKPLPQTSICGRGFVIIFQNIRQIYLAKERTLYNYKNDIYNKIEKEEDNKNTSIKEDIILPDLNLPGINEDNYVDIDGKKYVS